MCNLAISYTGSQIRSNKSFYHFIIIAMKKEKFVEINGITFEKKNLDPYCNCMDSIYQLYDRPSQEKVEIFDHWDQKLDRIYWLTGSKFAFSIYWEIKDQNGYYHDVKITKSHNYILN